MSIINPISKKRLFLPDISDTLVTQNIITPITNILSNNSITNNSTIGSDVNTIKTVLSNNGLSSTTNIEQELTTMMTLLNTNGLNNTTNLNTQINNLQTQIKNLPNSGIGSGTNFYLTNNSNLSNLNYSTISKTAPNNIIATLEKTITDLSGNVLLGQFMSDTNLNLKFIPDGIWNFSFFVNDSSDNGISLIYVEIWQYVDLLTSNLLFTMYGTDINSVVIIPYNITSSQPLFTVNETDFLVCKIYCNTTNTLETKIKINYNSSDKYSHFSLPIVISSSHQDLLNLQGGTINEYYHLSLSQINNLIYPATAV